MEPLEDPFAATATTAVTTPTTMSPERQAALDALALAGFDVSFVTDEIPDAFLTAFAAFVTQMQTATGITPPVPVAVDPLLTVASQRRYADSHALRAMQSQIAHLSRRMSDQSSMVNHQADQSKRTVVRQFCDQAVAQGRMSPAENDETSPHSLRTLMMEADNVRQYTFSQGGRAVQATQLEKLFGMVNARGAYKFSERVQGSQNQGGMVKPHIAKARERAALYFGGGSSRMSNAGKNNN